MKKQNRLSPTDALDRLLLRPLFGIPFFFAVLSLVLFLSFHGIGGMLANMLETVLFHLRDAAAQKLLRLGASEPAVRYLMGGICTAIAEAIAFLPQTVIFFVLVRALDECAYLPRATVVTDRFFRIFRISGNAAIPLLLGCGCAVSSVCPRCSDHSEQQNVTRALPFVPCSARLPVILFLTDTFFPTHKTLAATLIFALSFTLILISFLLFSANRKDAPALITELPDFRAPQAQTLWKEAIEKSIEYIKRAGTAVFLCSAVFSALAMLTPTLHTAEHVSQSILYVGATGIAAIFRPLGFDRPEMAAALFFGFFAKENIISLLELMAGTDLSSLISPCSAIAFTAFCIFYTPCFFLVSAEAKRIGAGKAFVLLLRTFLIAYTVSLILYHLSRLFLR